MSNVTHTSFEGLRDHMQLTGFFHFSIALT